MLICRSCHNARQSRQAIESQPLQFTGHISPIDRVTGCPDCGARSKGERFEYLNAYELMGELEEAREKLKKLEYSKPDFPLTDYHHAADMMEHVKSFPAVLSDPEAFRQVISYAAELEEMLD